jgi:hypothetical protein
MLKLLAFIAIFQGLKTALQCLLQDKSHAEKIAGNITSVINGVILIFSPFIIIEFGYDSLNVILQLNVAYNLVDFIHTSIFYKLHHTGVFICDYLISQNQKPEVQLLCMNVYSLIEISDIFVWVYYHRIHYSGFKPTRNHILIQLLWFGGFRLLGFTLGFMVCCNHGLIGEAIVLILLSVGSVFWTYGMYKKL